jgi:hypothetical protein
MGTEKTEIARAEAELLIQLAYTAIDNFLVSAHARHVSLIRKNKYVPYFLGEFTRNWQRFHSNVTNAKNNLGTLSDGQIADMLYKCTILNKLYDLKVSGLPKIPDLKQGETPYTITDTPWTAPVLPGLGDVFDFDFGHDLRELAEENFRIGQIKAGKSLERAARYEFVRDIYLSFLALGGNTPAIIAIAGQNVSREMRPKHHEDGFLFFDNTQLQRLGGYFNFYENFTSNEKLCDIDAVRIDFKNTDGKPTSIWFWKGDYNMTLDNGWHVGAEIGVYTNDLFANDKILKSASFTLKRVNDGTVLLNNRQVSGQYWINGFVPGHNDVAANLNMDITLEFVKEEDAKSFCISFEEVSKHLTTDKNYFPSNTLERQNRNVKDVSLVLHDSGSAKIIKVTFQ